MQITELPSRAEAGARQRVLIVSAFQDYRSRKRASIQQVADGLVSAGYDVSFISTRFSHLSTRTGDSRLFLSDRANRVELVNGVRCYLWRTPLHPFGSKVPLINKLMTPAFRLYSQLPNRTFDALVKEADYIIVESGVAVIYLRRIRKLNNSAKVVYYAADRLDTVGAHPFVQQQLYDNSDLIDHVCLRSSAMKDGFAWASGRLYKAEFGINVADFERITANPYASSLNAISVGSMLFDSGYFTGVAEHFPEVTFHVIGCGMEFSAPSNVVVYPEMRFQDTLPYLKHAAIGVAPYRAGIGVEYLAESSLKLAQYEYLGLPAVCSNFAAGDRPSRFGYVPGNVESMVQATRDALSAVGRTEKREFPTWEEVSLCLLHPEKYKCVSIS